MVTQIGGQEYVGAGVARGGEQGVPGATGHGNGLNSRLRVPADEQAGSGIGKRDGDGRSQVAQASRTLECADPPDALSRIQRIGLQRHGGEHADSSGEGGGDAPVGGIEGRVGVGQGDSGSNEAVN